LAELVTQAAGRIHVAAGGGLRLHNAALVARATGAEHFHGSLRSAGVVEALEVRAMISLLESA
jgi:copper homeostasis protein